MNIVTAAALLKKSKLEEFEDVVVKTAQAEIQKHAGELTESLNSLLDQKDSTPRLDRLVQQTKLAARMGRDMAKEAGIAGTIMGAVKPLAGKALGYAAQHPQRAMAAGGAALGALGGAANAQPGHRMSGALGGAALGGAAGYGLSRIPSGQALQQGVARYANQGLAKLAFAPMGKAMGAGALLGAVGGALHKSPGEAQGLASGHHLRNALVGAAGGAALGAGATKMPTMMGKAEGAVAHARPPMQAFHNPHAMPAAAAYTADEARQMARVKAMANSPQAGAARQARAMDAMRQNMQANPSLYGASAAKVTPAPAATMAARRPPASAVDPTGATLAKMAQRGGREFLKLAFSMSAQAEPGDPTGAQEPEAESQFQAEPQRPPSKPAADLFQALRHLTPKMMRNLQVAQPGA